MAEQFIEDLGMSMQKSVESFTKDIATIRTGRANVSILDLVRVEYYGFPTPLREVASVTIPEPQQIMIKPYEKETLKAIEKAIQSANIGLVPNNDGTVIRLNIPALSEERRKEYVKLLGKYSENAKVSIRNIRRSANDSLKKDKSLSEDRQRHLESEVQKKTDEFIKKIDELAKVKEKELMTI
ncbi:ribosome recycling factor [bacterium]|jgi:ribosome recycling factor|nr:ribosome recycling factor [bacterium]